MNGHPSDVMSRNSIILLLFLYFGFHIVAWEYLISAEFFIAFGRQGYLLSLLLENLIVTALAVAVCLPWFRKQLDRFAENRNRCIWISLAGIVFLFGVAVIMSLLVYNGIDASEPVNESNNLSYMQVDPFGFAISALVVGPIMEELVFRGAIQQPIAARFGKTAGIMTGAVLFGLIHMLASVGIGQWSDFIFFFQYAGCGAVLGYVTDASDTVCAGILTHMLYNGLSILLSVI